MDNDQRKDGDLHTVKFLIKLKEDDKALFAQFAKAEKKSLAEFFRTAAKEYVTSRGALAGSQVIGILENGLPNKIVRVPAGENKTFDCLVSHLKNEGYVPWGKSFRDAEGCILQLMVVKQPSKSDADITRD
jgi:hypothetical protein